MVDEAAVNRLLQQSREAHGRKKRSAGVVDKHGKVVSAPNWPEAEQHIVDALRLRMEAHALDPDHTASGWSIPIPPSKVVVPDAELIKFYCAYSLPFIPAEQLEQVYARFPHFRTIKYIP